MPSGSADPPASKSCSQVRDRISERRRRQHIRSHRRHLTSGRCRATTIVRDSELDRVNASRRVGAIRRLTSTCGPVTEIPRITRNRAIRISRPTSIKVAARSVTESVNAAVGNIRSHRRHLTSGRCRATTIVRDSELDRVNASRRVGAIRRLTSTCGPVTEIPRITRNRAIRISRPTSIKVAARSVTESVNAAVGNTLEPPPSPDEWSLPCHHDCP